MAFCREVHDGVGLMVVKELLECKRVAKITLNKGVALIADATFQRSEIPRIRQLVEIDNVVGSLINELPNEVRANKTSSAGYKNFHQGAPYQNRLSVSKIFESENTGAYIPSPACYTLFAN